MTDRETCAATKHNGERCKAWPAKGGALCAGHAGLGKLDAKLAGARSAEARSRRAAERRMTFQDHLAAELEKDAAKYVEAMRKAASEGDWRAYEAWTTRVHGKPIERVETVQNGLDPASMTSAQRAELRRKLVAENPELLELVPAREAA